MSTALDIINGSMRLIGAMASGEVLPANEATDALSVLNDMLASWSTENLIIYSKVEEEFTLTPSQQSYTMGTGGNFNTTRPLKIENAILRTVTGSTNFDLPIEIFNQDQWANISIKTTQSNIPTKLFAQGTYPLETIYLWPVPSEGKTLVLWSWKPLSSFATINSTFDLPPGYAKAIRYGLALELAPEYGRPLTDAIVGQFNEAKANIKRMNAKPQLLAVDAALLPFPPAFNWLTGE